MPDYKNMYTSLFNDVTTAVNILQEAQRKTEELYIEAKDPQIVLLQPPEDKSPDGAE